MLRAIGATPARVAQTVVIEGMTVGVMAWLVATATVGPLSKAIGGFLLRGIVGMTQNEVTVAMAPIGIAIWLVVSLAGSALASLWSARRASRTSVRDALTYE